MKHLKIKINKYEIDWEIILQNIDFIFNENDKISLVWWNWAWKTTLMKIISWEIKEFDWFIENIWNVNIWYLSQIFDNSNSITVKEEIKSWFIEILKIEEKLKNLEEKMSNNPTDEIIQEYSETLEVFNNIWWYNYESIIHHVSSWLWVNHLLDKKIDEISGWERTKVALCKILIMEPEILLLDEPTNFIDMAWVEWLEGYLQNKWKSWYLIISHDREFLDKTCKKTFELLPKRPLNFYHYNYSKYIEEREKIWERQIKEWEMQQEFIKKEENLINRFRAWSRASFAQSREKALSRLEKIEKPFIPKVPKFFFDYLDESPNKILYFKEVFIWRKDPLFYINEISLNYKDRVWIVWENWVWKSTLLKTIMRKIEPLDWIFTIWKGVKTVYYSQMHEELDLEKDIKDNFLKFNISLSDEQLTWYLKYYLIDRELIYKPVKYLSWWQRSKLLFAILWQIEANLLIFDEPTNHLDYDSKEELEKSINNYKWTVLFISHDRYFVNKVATHLWIIKNQELVINYWNYEDFKYKIEHDIDINMNLFDACAEMDMVLMEKLGEKEAKRIKEKYSRKKK